MAALTCRRCQAGPFDSLAAIRAHHRAEHGLRSGFGINAPSPQARPAIHVSRGTRRRIEDVSGGQDADDPIGTGSSDGSETPGTPDPRPALDPSRPSRPSIAQAPIRITPEHTAQGVREAIRDALPSETLAMLIKSLSVAVSEADGAGPAGYLSEIQSAQVAALLYDATVDLVVTRFNGDVTRFKAGMAVILILVSKGGVHGRAIRDRVRERRQRFVPVMPDGSAEPTEDLSDLSAVEIAMRNQARQPVVSAG